MKLLAILLVIPAYFSCQNKENLQTKETTLNDTIITKIDVSDKSQKAMQYSMIIKGDTSRASVTLRKDMPGEILLRLSTSSTHKDHKDIKPYRLRYKEIEELLKEASKDFNFDSLRYINPGWLADSGDLTIEASREYYKRYGNPGECSWNNIDRKKLLQICDVLMNSRTGTDLNKLLAPYGKKIGEVTVLEKPMFESKKRLFKHSLIETPETQIPEYILDGRIEFSVIDK